jgi:hypothetical protein
VKVDARVARLLILGSLAQLHSRGVVAPAAAQACGQRNAGVQLAGLQVHGQAALG